MNLKKFFYQDYFFHSFRDENGRQHKISLKKSEDKRTREEISEKNEPAYKDANRKLTGYTLATPASDLLDFQKQSRKSVHSFQLITTYPGLFTGSGYNHETGSPGELKLGFFFDHTSGLPVLPGSSVKGILRSIFPQCKKSETDPLQPVFSEDKTKARLQKNKANFAGALFGMPKDSFALVHRLELAIFEGADIEKTEAERAKARAENKPDPDKILCHLPIAGHDIFLDSFISKGNGKGKILGTDALTPHGGNPLKNPIPLPFLKVLPEVTFTFQFLLNDSILNDQTTITASRKKVAFSTILEALGAGAKSNVGYGQFTTHSVAGPAPKPKFVLKHIDQIRRGDTVKGKLLRFDGGLAVFQLELEGFDEEVKTRNPRLRNEAIGKNFLLSIANKGGRRGRWCIDINFKSVAPFD
jgi:CRISPR-associated protein Cmr6